MTDPLPHPDTNDVHDTEPARPAPPAATGGGAMPRWVKISGLIVAVVVVIFVGAQLLGVGGDHGPGRHGGDDPPTGMTEHDGGGHTPPPGMDHDG